MKKSIGEISNHQDLARFDFHRKSLLWIQTYLKEV